jgi:hypothetical protein
MTLYDVLLAVARLSERQPGQSLLFRDTLVRRIAQIAVVLVKRNGKGTRLWTPIAA